MQDYSTVLDAVAGTPKSVTLGGDFVSVRNCTGELTITTDQGESDTFKMGEATRFEKRFRRLDIVSTVASDPIQIVYGFGWKLAPWNFPGGVPGTPSFVQGVYQTGNFVPFADFPLLLGAVDAGHSMKELQVIDNFGGGVFQGQKVLAAAPSKLSADTPVFPVGGSTQNLPLFSANKLVVDVSGLVLGDVYLFGGRVQSGGALETLVWRDKFGAIVNAAGQLLADGIYHADVSRYNFMDVDGTGIVTPAGVTVHALLVY